MDPQTAFIILFTITFLNSFTVQASSTSSEDELQDQSLSSREQSHISCGLEKNFPRVVQIKNKNINSQPIFENNTYIELRSHVQDIAIICNATYPVEWVFPESLGSEVSVREVRGLAGRLQMYMMEISFKSMGSVLKNLTCRSVSVNDKACLQTTVRIQRKTVNKNQTTVFQILPNFPKGQTVNQYFNNETNYGDNPNCSIHLHYNPKDKRFECYSETENSLLVSVNSDIEDCYDQFTCAMHYNKMRGKECRKNSNHVHNQNHEIVKLDLSDIKPNTQGLTGIIICKKSQEEGRVRESHLVASATSHFFFSLPDLCSSKDFEEQSLYVDLELLSVTKRSESEFISLCEFKGPLYRKDYQIVNCSTSLYFFADGIKIIVKRNNGSSSVISNVTFLEENNSESLKKRGYRTYETEIHIDSTNIVAIECSAPIRKHKAWHSKEISITVLDPKPITFEDGSAPLTIKYTQGNDIVIRCSADGTPHPKLSWIINANAPKFKDFITEDQGKGWIQITIPTNHQTSNFTDVYTCKAENRLEFVQKTFIVQKSGILEEQDEESFISEWGIITFLPVGLLIVGIVIGFLVWKILKQQKKLRLLSQAEIDEFMNGKPEVLMSSRSSSQYDVNTYATCLPYNKDYEVLKEQLEIDVNSILGSGAYGIVLKGILTTKYGEKVRVAIKTVKPMDDISYFKALMSELKIMGFIGKHDNIVNLLAAYTKNIQNREIFIAIEYCDNGCMLHYIRNQRPVFANFVNNGVMHPSNGRASIGTNTQIMSTFTLLKWGLQIANGMDFLYHKKVIHGDLAARNVLLSNNLTAKIGDFGLSRQLFEYANYIKKHQSPLPWKWLALECLQDMKFSSKSDVWAYGITLWEIFSLGHSPYPGFSYNEEYIESLVMGKRPSKPQFSTNEIYSMMKTCWEVNPSDRPTFHELKKFFDETIRSVLPEDYVDIQDPMDLNCTLPRSLSKAKLISTNESKNSNSQIQLEIRSGVKKGNSFRSKVSFKNFKF